MLEYARSIDGFMLDVELEWLYEHAKGMETIVEIGTHKGRSAMALSEGLGTEGELICVDPWKDETVFDEFLKTYNNRPSHFSKVTIFRTTSVKAASELIQSVDMVFIDGSHEYHDVIEDIRLWHPRAKKLVCGHDYGKPDGQWAGFREWEGVKQAVQEYYGGRNIKVNSLIWSVEKR